jgi:hypothetical protein
MHVLLKNRVWDFRIKHNKIVPLHYIANEVKVITIII